MPDKGKSRRRIDGLVAAIMSQAGILNEEQPAASTPGMIFDDDET
jgi:hypothetical protein